MKNTGERHAKRLKREERTLRERIKDFLMALGPSIVCAAAMKPNGPIKSVLIGFEYTPYPLRNV